jgi:hypothetical protein
MKIATGHPISMTIAPHNHLAVRYSPHFPCFIIARGYCDVFSRMNRDSVIQNKKNYQLIPSKLKKY